MKRSLRRKIESAINETWNPRRNNARGQVTVVVSFPEGAFSDAPQWSPGSRFEATAGAGSEYAWLRDNLDGSSTAVVAGVGPKEQPAADGGLWTEPEVWTVTAPTTGTFMGSGDLWDKPHRITRLLNEPEAVIHREPYSGHPAADMHDYWEQFEQQWGFVPGRMSRGLYPFADHRRFVTLHAMPGWDNLANEVELLKATILLARTFNGTPRVYGYDPQRRDTRDPIGAASSDPTLDHIVRRLGLTTR